MLRVQPVNNIQNWQIPDYTYHLAMLKASSAQPRDCAKNIINLCYTLRQVEYENLFNFMIFTYFMTLENSLRVGFSRQKKTLRNAANFQLVQWFHLRFQSTTHIHNHSIPSTSLLIWQMKSGAEVIIQIIKFYLVIKQDCQSVYFFKILNSYCCQIKK